MGVLNQFYKLLISKLNTWAVSCVIFLPFVLSIILLQLLLWISLILVLLCHPFFLVILVIYVFARCSIRWLIKVMVGRVDILLAFSFFLLWRNFVNLVLHDHVRVVCHRSIQIFNAKFRITLISMICNSCSISSCLVSTHATFKCWEEIVH